MAVRVAQLAACLLSTVIVPLLALDASDVFPRLPSLSSDEHVNPAQHKFLSHSFGVVSSEVVHIRRPQHGCNSERLRTVLEQSISDSRHRSLWAILARLHDAQFSVNCLIDGTPVLPQRPLFCQMTIGHTTCAITAGHHYPGNTSLLILRKAKIFRPRAHKIVRTRTPVQEVEELSQILATMGPEPSRKKRRSDGLI